MDPGLPEAPSLASGASLILANAAHVKNVPGRKTDVADAVWLSDLLAHGLIRPSFVPDAGTRAMRDLLRTRKQLVREQASHVQRIQKTLEDANLKLASVLTDIMGQSGRAVLAALAAGETDPGRLQALVGSRVKASPEAIRAALTGRPGPHHRFLLGLHLGQIDALAAAVAAIDAEVERDLGPFREAVALLATIPGVGELTAEVVLSEIGLDMGRFPSAGHLLSWAGLCPRQDESAGKRRSTRLKKGAPWLKTALVQAAWAAVRKKHSYLNAQFQRLRARRGPRKAICAVAASMLTAAYHMLGDGTFYADPGPDHFRRTDPMTRAKALARQIERLGFKCSISTRGASFYLGGFHDLPVGVLSHHPIAPEGVEVAAPDLDPAAVAGGAGEGPFRDAGVPVHEVLGLAVVDVGQALEARREPPAHGVAVPRSARPTGGGRAASRGRSPRRSSP